MKQPKQLPKLKILGRDFQPDQRLTIFFFCLLLSAFFWFLSALSKAYTTSFSYPIQYSGQSDDRVLTEPPAASIKVWVEGNGFDLIGEKLRWKKRSLNINLLSEARYLPNGRGVVRLDRFQNDLSEQLGNKLNVLYLSPDTIGFLTEQRISKTVPIHLRSRITLGPQSIIHGKVYLEPAQISISGPSSFIKGLESVYTDSLILEQVTDSILSEVKIDKSDMPEGVRLSSKSTKVIGKVEKYTEKRIRLPIEVQSADAQTKLRVFPNEVEAVCLVPISKFESLTASAAFKAVVTFDESKGNKRKLKVDLIRQPDYVEVISLQPDKVEYIIRK